MEEDLDTVCARLFTIPWAARLLRAENQTVVVLPTRVLRKDERGQSHDLFFSTTLKTDDTISAFVMFHDNGASPNSLVRELRGIFTVGDKLCGFPGIVHGGVVTCIMDELMGVLNTLNIERKAVSGGAYMTAYLNTTFKSPIKTEATYFAVAKLDKIEGRKFFVSQTIEDGEGKVLASAEAMFLRLKEAL